MTTYAPEIEIQMKSFFDSLSEKIGAVTRRLKRRNLVTEKLSISHECWAATPILDE